MPPTDGMGSNSGKPVKKGTVPGKQCQGKRQEFRKPAVRQPRFEGKCEELKGHIYDCSDS